ncbi:MAG: polysaccharide biosynthesis tyrosine autokinase [Verrucomicrobia subdivision 3 bacterium]|nr:polysaccharide biosynthesis tyrosine autokinase [Limisphaerales bacterium]
MENAKQATFNAPEVKLHFLDYWRIIRLRKTVILAVFLLVTITTTVVTFILPKAYASSVRMKVEKDSQDVGGLGSERQYTGYDPYWVQTEFETIQSKSILHQVITNLNLSRKWAEKYKEEGELPTDLTYQILKSKIDVRQSRNTSLIEVRAFSEDNNEAAVIANEIASVYRESRVNQRRMYSARGVETLNKEFENQDKLVKKQQAEVDAMKEELGISDWEAQQGYSMSTVEPETLRKLEGMRIEQQASYEQIHKLYTHLAGLARPELKKAVQVASPDSHLGLLLDRQAESDQKLALAIENYSENHPEVAGLRRLLQKIDTQINDRLDGILEGLKAKTASEKAALDQLAMEVDKAKKVDIDAAIKRRPYFQAKRDLESLQLVRERLTLRIIQETVDAAIPKSGIVEIIDPAEPSLRAVRPNKKFIIPVAVVIGLALGIGLAFFIEYLDTSVKTIDDVERALQSPVLGVIPQNVGSLLQEGPDSPHAEAYRVLRTNILFSQKEPNGNTITIVSGGAGEGKSTTTFNLATIFAQNGQRVLVVDSDLRRPSLHKILKVSNAVGLTNYLLKQNALEEVIQTTGLATLDFMPSGKLPSSSMGVLSSVQMKEMIQDLKRRYDWVFFDSPPIMGVSDASILASEVDIVLQVIQYRRYPQPMTIRAKQMIEKVGGNLLGIVLNNISMASDENYYYYSGYYYDYYSKQDEEEPEVKANKRGKAEERAEIKQKY